jgi:hypothetical protein
MKQKTIQFTTKISCRAGHAWAPRSMAGAGDLRDSTILAEHFTSPIRTTFDLHEFGECPACGDAASAISFEAMPGEMDVPDASATCPEAPPRPDVVWPRKTLGARNAACAARQAAQRLGFDIVERQVHSVDELRAALLGLKAGEVDALFPGADAVAVSHERTGVADGGLASYGPSIYAAGRLAARYLHRVLSG